MNVKSMLVGFLIAVVASTGTYFLMPPPSGAEATDCASVQEVLMAVQSVVGNCDYERVGEHTWYRPRC